MMKTAGLWIGDGEAMMEIGISGGR